VSGDLRGPCVSFVCFGGGAPRSSPEVTLALPLVAGGLSAGAAVSLFAASGFELSLGAGAEAALGFDGTALFDGRPARALFGCASTLTAQSNIPSPRSRTQPRRARMRPYEATTALAHQTQRCAAFANTSIDTHLHWRQAIEARSLEIESRR
jgi:hypothetical protein